MREHETCEEAIFSALAAGKPGKAEFLAARCDLKHGHLTVPSDAIHEALHTSATTAGNGATAQEEDQHG